MVCCYATKHAMKAIVCNVYAFIHDFAHSSNREMHPIVGLESKHTAACSIESALYRDNNDNLVWFTKSL